MAGHIDSETALVLSKLFTGKGRDGNAKDIRDAIEPGSYAIDTTVRIQGRMHVEHDKKRVVYMNVPWMDLAAYALSKMNKATREKVMREAILGNLNTDEIKEEATQVVRKILGSNPSPVRGSVTFKHLSVTELS